jgi:hypothetical protein
MPLAHFGILIASFLSLVGGAAFALFGIPQIASFLIPVRGQAISFPRYALSSPGYL